MAIGEQLAELLADLQTITATARAGIISTRDEVLEPGETRLAAILFVDIVGFAELAHSISSELLTKVVDRAFRIFELTVRSQGGYCDKVIGDAALYVFAGHPNYPPVCEAALLAALKLGERVGKVNESLGETGVMLAIRQGVAFGEVTRQAVGAEHAQLTVMGDTVNQAQRLQASSQPGSIQTTSRVLEKAGDHFRRELVGKLELKGIGAVTAYRISGVEQQAVRLRGAFRRMTPLIGRDEEMREALAQVDDWLAVRYPPGSWDIAQASAPLQRRNRLLIVGGVPAVGKSRFAYELAEQLRTERNAVYATAHCAEHASLATFTAELTAVAGLTAENLPERWEALCANAERLVSPEYAERQRQHLRLLANVLDCTAVDAGTIRQSDPPSFALSCQLAIRACCELAAHEGRPVVLVIEDLQWMAGLYVVISDVLEHACLPQPLVVIGTARPEFNPANLGACGEGARIFELGTLSRERGTAIIQAGLPGLELPQRIADELHEKAAGIPYFYEDFARMLARRHLAAEVDGVWRLAAGIDTLDIPEDIQTLELGRLDQLDSTVRELARRASVLGRSFDRSLLAAIEKRLGYDHAGHPDDDLSILLMEKMLARDDGGRYFYEHLLLREAAYSSLLSANRRLLHGIAADILTGLHVPGSAGELELLEQLVDHLERSGRYAQAHRRTCELMRAAANLLQLAAWDEWTTRAVRLWAMAQPEGPGGSAGGAAGPAGPAQPVLDQAGLPPSAELHLALCEWHYRQGRIQQAEQLGRITIELARAGGQAREEAWASLRLADIMRYRGRTDEAWPLYERTLAVFRELRNRRGEAVTLHNLASLCSDGGRMEQAQACYTESMAIFRELGHSLGVGAALCNLGDMYSEQGRMEEAGECLKQSLEIFRELGNRGNEAHTLHNLGSLHRDQGRMQEARECYEQSLVIRRELGDRDGEGWSLSSLGCLLADTGDLEQAVACQLAAQPIAAAIGSSSLRGSCLLHLGRFHAWQGKMREARAALEEAMAARDELQDKEQLGALQCSWVYYHLATAGFIPEHVRQAKGAAGRLPVSAAPAAALAAALSALAGAEARQRQIAAGPRSRLGQDAAKARAAVLDFTRRHDLPDQASSQTAREDGRT